MLRPACRASVRRICIFLAVAVTIGMGLQSTFAQDVRRGGTLVDAVAWVTESLDPHITSNRNNAWMMLLFDTLLNYEFDLETGEYSIGPALATSFDVVDPLTLEFALRQGVTFHDGSAWNAEVAKWNLERAMDFDGSVVDGTLAGVESIEIVDEYVFRVHLKGPQPVLPLQLTQANPFSIWFLSKEAVERLGDDEFGRQPVGTGPFQFERWLVDERLDLVRYDSHWEIGVDGHPLPYLDGYSFRVIRDQTVANVELRSGAVHAVFDPAHRDVSVLERDPNVKVQQLPGTFRGFPNFYFNPAVRDDRPFSQDVRLRMAGQMAIDRQAMADALGFGFGEPHHIFGWFPGVPGFDPDLAYPYDPEQARQLLAEAGYPGGIDLEVKVINRTIDVQPLEVLQAMWADVGIRLSINLMDRLEWVADSAAMNFEALSHGSTAQPEPLLRQETRTGTAANFAGYSSPEVDALWVQAEAEYDPDERARIYREIQQHLYDDAFHLAGYRFARIVALKENLMGVTMHHGLRYAWFR